MGGKSRKSGGISKKLVQQLLNDAKFKGISNKSSKKKKKEDENAKKPKPLFGAE